MRTGRLILAAIVAALGAASSCSERHFDNDDDVCYFVDDAADYGGPPYTGWCEYELGQVTHLLEEHCPAGECVDYFITCDEVPIAETCQTCSAEQLDHKVLVALGAEYQERCPDGPRELIDFERGCTFETEPVPPSNETKRCCYTAIVVGECSLMGT